MYYYEYWINGLGDYMARVYMDSSYTDIWYFQMAKQLGPVGLEENIDASQAVKFYPNPVNNILNIELDIMGAMQYEVLDLQGRMVSKGKLGNQEVGHYTLDMADLEKGTYLLRISQGKTIISSKMILKE
jgi:hypothetical protein